MKKEAELTNLDKVYWPDEDITKGELLDYYRQMAPYILPYLKNRPLSLKRNPNGIRDKGFYQKDAGNIAPKWVKTVAVHSESTDEMVHFLVCNDVESLLFIANLGCIEMNPWNSTINKLDRPDYIAIDLDPSNENTFDQVVDVALAVKEIMDETGMTGYCKTSGSSGLHIYIPFNKKHTYGESRDFAEILASMVNDKLPEITTLERSLSKRKKDQIYMDYMQNAQGQTLASVYSVRPKPGATVSAPLDWTEVKHGLNPRDFTIKNTTKRVEEKGDLFKGILDKGIDMGKVLMKMEALHAS